MPVVDTQESPSAPGAGGETTYDPARPPEPTRHVPRMRYMPGLDGLRAVAVLGVLFYHADVSWMPGGFLGVDVFFVLSGYLITALLLAEFRNKREISLKQFYLRRARRLLPALFLVLGAVSLFAVIFLPEEITKLRGDVIAALGYATNWYQIFHHQSYFDAVGRPPMLQHLWSLAVEEQFYLVWPLLVVGMLKLWKGRRRPMLIATLSGVAASTILLTALSVSRGYPLAHDPSRVYFGTDTRISTMLVGAALALVWAPSRLSERVPRGGIQVLDAIGVIALAVLLWIFFTVSQFSNALYRGGFLGVAVVSAVVIAVTVHPAAHLSAWVLGHKPLRWLGERSYGIYLWHWPIFMVTRPTLDIWLTGFPNLVLRFALTIGAAALSFRYVEQPVRQGALGRWYKAVREAKGAERARVASHTAATTGVVALGVVLVTVGLATARPARLTPGLAAVVATPNTTATTVTTAPATTPATAAPNPALPRVAAIGDSVMLGATPALAAQVPGVWVNAQVSRGFGNGIDLIRSLHDNNQLGDTVVVHLGTNGVITDGQMEALLAILEGPQARGLREPEGAAQLGGAGQRGARGVGAAVPERRAHRLAQPRRRAPGVLLPRRDPPAARRRAVLRRSHRAADAGQPVSAAGPVRPAPQEQEDRA